MTMGVNFMPRETEIIENKKTTAEKGASKCTTPVNESEIYDLADFYKVFGDSTRLKILITLMDKECSVTELTQKIGAEQSAISHQLRVLKQTKFVKSRKYGKMVLYSLADDHINTIICTGFEHIRE